MEMSRARLFVSHFKIETHMRPQSSMRSSLHFHYLARARKQPQTHFGRARSSNMEIKTLMLPLLLFGRARVSLGAGRSLFWQARAHSIISGRARACH